jgi:hypothetical protein
MNLRRLSERLVGWCPGYEGASRFIPDKDVSDARAQYRWAEQCRMRLMNESEERNVSLSDEDKGFPLSKLVHIIFSRVVPGLVP